MFRNDLGDTLSLDLGGEFKTFAAAFAGCFFPPIPKKLRMSAIFLNFFAVS
jgi:hypothetical protein